MFEATFFFYQAFFRDPVGAEKNNLRTIHSACWISIVRDNGPNVTA